MITQKPSQTFYMPLAMFFVSFYLTANVLGPKPVLLGDCVIPAGLFIFPLNSSSSESILIDLTKIR